MVSLPAPSSNHVRKRGLLLVLAAVVVVVVLLLLLAGTRPELGQYPGWVQGLTHLLWLLAVVCFGTGSFHAVVGAPGEGVFRGVRTPVALLIGVAAALSLAVGGFVLQVSLTAERTAADDDEHHDWDWD